MCWKYSQGHYGRLRFLRRSSMMMNMSFQLVVHVLLAANFMSKHVKASDGEDLCANVFERHQDYALFGHVIDTSHTINERECGLKCMKTDTCQSYNYQTSGNLGNRTCELNNQTRQSKPADWKKKEGFTYYGSVPVSCLPKSNNVEERFSCHPGFKGSRCLTKKIGYFSSEPGQSCKHIRDSGDSMGDGEYWIDPENSGSPLKAFCDMTTDEGGWLLVANFVMNSSTAPPDWSAETTYRGISNYHNNRMGITATAMRTLRSHMSFTQLRFYCSKQQGSTFHVTTATNSTGEAVVQYFSWQTHTLPDSCNSFVKSKDDNSRLAAQCHRWGNDGGHYVGKWGHHNKQGETRMYDHAAFVANQHHWITVGGTWSCDDAGASGRRVSSGDFWKVYVR